MPLTVLVPKYRRDPNAMVHSAYVGVAQGNRTVTTVNSFNKNTERMETTRVFGQNTLARGQSGHAGTFILGGMVTTLDEVEYLVEAAKEKKFVRQKSSSEIAAMCHELQERRNEQIKYLRKNPSEIPQVKPRRRGLFLPTGVRMVPTGVPGLRIAVGV